VPRRAEPARINRGDAEAIEVAERLAGRFAAGAAERDRERISSRPAPPA
jgi:hypothetical protein